MLEFSSMVLPVLPVPSPYDNIFILQIAKCIQIVIKITKHDWDFLPLQILQNSALLCTREQYRTVQHTMKIHYWLQKARTLKSPCEHSKKLISSGESRMHEVSGSFSLTGVSAFCCLHFFDAV